MKSLKLLNLPGKVPPNTSIKDNSLELDREDAEDMSSSVDAGVEVSE